MDAAAVTSTSDAPIGDKVQTSTPGPQSPTQPHSLPLDSCLRRHTKLKRNMAPADDENPPCAYVCLSVRLSVRPPVHPMCIHSPLHQTVSSTSSKVRVISTQQQQQRGIQREASLLLHSDKRLHFLALSLFYDCPPTLPHYLLYLHRLTIVFRQRIRQTSLQSPHLLLLLLTDVLHNC